jgi:hypothetical protein
MKEQYQIINLRNIKNENPRISEGDKVCLCIHDTEDKNLSGGSYAEFGDFLKSSYIANCLVDWFKISNYEYVLGDEKIGYFQACIMKLYGTVLDGEHMLLKLNELSCLGGGDDDDTVEKRGDLWSDEIHGLDFQLSDQDLWLEPSCQLPELFKATKLRHCLYHAVFVDDEEIRIEIIKEIKRIDPLFPEEDFFAGPNITGY